MSATPAKQRRAERLQALAERAVYNYTSAQGTVTDQAVRMADSLQAAGFNIALYDHIITSHIMQQRFEAVDAIKRAIAELP